MVAPRRPPIPTFAVAATSAFETKKIIYADSAAYGTRRAMEITMTSITSAVIRNIRNVRGRESVSSSRKNCHSFERGARQSVKPWVITLTCSVAIMMDDRDRGCSNPHQVLGRAIQQNSHRKSLGDPYPIEISPDGGHPGDTKVFQLGNGRPDAFNPSF